MKLTVSPVLYSCQLDMIGHSMDMRAMMTDMNDTLEDVGEGEPWFYNSQAITLVAEYMLGIDKYTKVDIFGVFECPEEYHEAYIEMNAMLDHFLNSIFEDTES